VRARPDAPLVIDEAIAKFTAEYGERSDAAIAVLMPAFNEWPSVGGVVRSVPETICGLLAEVILVDDGSGDGTADAARDAGAMVCRLETNLGQGYAFQAGYRLALDRGATYIATIDADGQFDGAEIEGLVARLLAGEADFVNGSRRLGRTEANTPMRSLGLIVFSVVMRCLLGVRITDPANGLRAFRAEVVRGTTLRQPQYQAAELLIHAVTAGFRVAEAPVTVYARRAGTSKKGGDFLYGANFARVVLTTWWGARRRRRRSGPRQPGYAGWAR
jgi:glycosyltransferase involved in cell wall biosynthesis